MYKAGFRPSWSGRGALRRKTSGSGLLEVHAAEHREDPRGLSAKQANGIASDATGKSGACRPARTGYSKRSDSGAFV